MHQQGLCFCFCRKLWDMEPTRKMSATDCSNQDYLTNNKHSTHLINVLKFFTYEKGWLKKFEWSTSDNSAYLSKQRRSVWKQVLQSKTFPEI